MISFVITARDESPHVVRRTVEELRATTPRHEREIIVVDDGSVDTVGGLPAEVRLIRNDQPMGVSRARRHGTSLASGDVLVWLDAHMTFERDWVDHMLAHVDSGALLCSAFWDYERTICHCFGADFVWSGERCYEESRYPGFGLRHRVAFPGCSAVDVPMVIGACYMMLRSSYEGLGGFSPLFRVWGADEQDLSARAWLAGYGAKCVVDAGVGHLWRPAFPYPVQFEHLEFNQLVLARTVFDDSTARLLESFFEPLPEQVCRWLEETQLTEWRAVAQAARRRSDRAFFEAFVPEFQLT